MKAFRILENNIKESFKGVFRNFSLSLASISCITITLILVGFSILLSCNVNNFTNEIEKDIIAKHMWPLTLRHVPKYKESIIVTMVDKYCSTKETFEPLVYRLKQRKYLSNKKYSN